MVTLKKVRATLGEMRTLITAQALVARPDGTGGQDAEWVEILTFYGKVTWLSGSEAQVADRTQDYDTCRIIGRYDPRLTSKHRLLFGAYEPLNIRSVTNVDERNHIMVVTAERNVGT